MSEEVSKTESGLSEKDQKILSMLTPGERIILARLLELHPSDKAFDLFDDAEQEAQRGDTYILLLQSRLVL